MTITRATTRDMGELADALTGAFPRLDATDRRVAIATYRTLARGFPASPDAISAAADVATAEAEERLGAWLGVFRDGDGLVIGFWGLTVEEMPPHQLQVGDVKLWAWCAWDTLLLPARLGGSLQIRSICPVTKHAIELRVAPDHVESVAPDGIVVSFLSPDRRFDGDVISSFCHFVHFFASPRAGEEWVDRHPGTFLLTLPEAVELARLANVSLGLTSASVK